MINLAGHKNPDPIVEEELFIAGVEIVRADEPQKGEVATRISGRLGAITFSRAWYYWIVNGDVPIEIARKIYAQEPYGVRDVRVSGHCGCPPPEDPWVEYRDVSGKQIAVLTESNRTLFDQYRDKALGPYLHEVIGKMLGEITFVDTKEEQERLSTTRVVTTYHIDSQAGLKVFVDAMLSGDV